MSNAKPVALWGSCRGLGVIINQRSRPGGGNIMYDTEAAPAVNQMGQPLWSAVSKERLQAMEATPLGRLRLAGKRKVEALRRRVDARLANGTMSKEVHWRINHPTAEAIAAALVKYSHFFGRVQLIVRLRFDVVACMPTDSQEPLIGGFECARALQETNWDIRAARLALGVPAEGAPEDALAFVDELHRVFDKEEEEAHGV